ncbi:MAG TPA: hypothetical protein VE442_04940 [Jatrophihabitans sp.]|nr:hypothetical protein [Jatrophihabitans sp.]
MGLPAGAWIDRVLGRVNAAIRALILGLYPLAALPGRMLGELIGARTHPARVVGADCCVTRPSVTALRDARNVADMLAYST